MTYNIVAETNEQTVVSEYIPDAKRSEAYQSEAALEAEFIRLLSAQGYGTPDIKSEADLIANLRKQLEKLNNYTFTNGEWRQFFDNYITNGNEGIAEKTKKIQEEDTALSFTTELGRTQNIRLLDKKNIHNNSLQVINQYEAEGGKRPNRYDVTILVNGLPLVHIELKRRGVAIREAFNQINRYKRESFWSDSGLFEFAQIFVISNGTHTKYYSNTTREAHVNEANGDHNTKKASNTFEFTNYWADANNRVIPDLVDFTKTFFAKHTVLNILTKYCVFTSEDKLLVMRPYQIVATERILGRIEIAHNYHFEGSIKAGGYIWHSTGSGKTLTSFKTARIASALDYVDQVIFVVDRKDLDYQTMKEYDRFEKGSANGNNNTKTLTRQLENKNERGNFQEYRIIVTTIQKLSVFVAQNRTHDIYRKHVVLIFDECHRSQFGKMHKNIIEKFKAYNIFGYTGTPIFAANASNSGDPFFKTTAQAFGCALHGDDMTSCAADKHHQSALHTYTIVDAINDSNVLPFRIDYIDTVRMKNGVKDVQVAAIDTERAMVSPERIKAVVSYILDHYDQKTYNNENYAGYAHRVITNVEEMAAARSKADESKTTRRVNGFNSILAVSSAVTIDGKRVAPVQLYYEEFKRRLAESGKGLKIATIFSFSQNEDELMEQDEDFDTESLDQSSRDFLDRAIADYNAMFGTTYDSSSDKFQNYYKDLSLRVKNREVDLLIVVNMFLTGFDATTLNTLWVDKNLRQHGLIQAFSRTNRILNSVKKFGNIVCFRNLQKETDEAVALFGDKEAGGVVILRTFREYMDGFDDDKGKHQPGYAELVDRLKEEFPLGQEIVGEENQKEFIRLFGSILKVVNVLSAFDEFQGQERLSIRDYQNYQSIYLDIRDDFRNKPERENINDDIVFELELIKQVEVNIDYILMLVAKYHDGNCADKTILDSIDKAIGSSPGLRSKKELIESFIARVNMLDDVDSGWREYVAAEKEKELAAIIAEENLKDKEARKFINNAFRDGAVKTTGSDVDKILPPVSRFGGGNRAEKKRTVIEKLLAFFEKFFGVA
jgi:type I restriction enzyme R subunit